MASRFMRDCPVRRLPHGAKLLAKDVRLLGEVLGADPGFVALRDVAEPFLKLVEEGQAKP